MQKEQIKSHVMDSQSVTTIIYSIITIHLATYIYIYHHETQHHL